LATYRRGKFLPWLRPDGKCQVTMEYRGGRPVRVAAIVVSCQHEARVSLEEVRERVGRLVLECVIPRCLVDADTIVLVNPAGSFVQGGPAADTGLTGRKIIVDTYGGAVPHGGGAFSGKDPTKVDRSASYAARHIAKNLVAADLCERCEIQIAYAIGEPEPVSVMVNTWGTGALPDAELTRRVRGLWDLRPREIIRALDLRRPIYRRTAAYGHFGRREDGFTWELTDRVDDLKRG
jgi:S-adenosylmethionine synthetase